MVVGWISRSGGIGSPSSTSGRVTSFFPGGTASAGGTNFSGASAGGRIGRAGSFGSSAQVLVEAVFRFLANRLSMERPYLVWLHEVLVPR